MGKPLRALIVEDSEDDALLLLRELSKGDYDPVSERVYTADAMRSALQHHQWDVIICDYVVPAFGATAALKLLQDAGLDVPFIVVSGKVGEEAAIEIMKSGAHDYVLKDNLARLNPAIERELHDAGERRARAEAEEALRQADQRLKFHVENSPTAAIEWGADLRIIGWTKAAERVFGWRADEVVGEQMDRMHWVHEEDTQIVREAVADLLEGRHPRNVSRNRNYRKDGSVIYCEWHNSALRDSAGDLVSVMSVVLDVTEREMLSIDRENARRALEDVYNRERRIAETLQRNFLPDKALTLQGYDVVDAYEPALDEAAIGGDVYDTFELPGGKAGIVIADVSGKGLRAARHGAMVKYMLRAYAYRTEDPAAVMSMLNASVGADLDLDAFVTCFFGVLDIATRTLTYANAGHDEPMRVSRESGTAERLDVTGSALGLSQDSEYGVSTIALEPGDTLFLYTDGVTDARGTEPRLGPEGLEQFICANCALSARALVECVLAEVKRRSGDRLADDVAMVALEVL